jgi:hypothetical protein
VGEILLGFIVDSAGLVASSASLDPDTCGERRRRPRKKLGETAESLVAVSIDDCGPWWKWLPVGPDTRGLGEEKMKIRRADPNAMQTRRVHCECYMYTPVI